MTHEGAKASAPDHRRGRRNNDVTASIYWDEANPTATGFENGSVGHW